MGVANDTSRCAKRIGNVICDEPRESVRHQTFSENDEIRMASHDFERERVEPFYAEMDGVEFPIRAAASDGRVWSYPVPMRVPRPNCTLFDLLSDGWTISKTSTVERRSGWGI